MTEYTHKHHKIPRHAGGTDDPSNLVELTVLDHAIAHKVLYGLWGRWQDKIAWETLSGQLSNYAAKIQAIKLAHIGHSPWNKGKRGLQQHSSRSKLKISAYHKGRPKSKKSNELRHQKMVGKGNHRYGKRWFNNGKEEINSVYQPGGFIEGRLSRMWITDGSRSLTIKVTDAVPKGYKRGRKIQC